jgi:magnesium-transporting ATPase (P-type)
VHGFWSYSRVSILVNFIFYKAVLLAFTQYLFGFLSGFSAQQFFHDALYQWYNVFYTAAPIMAVAIWGKDLPAILLENNPAALYYQKDTKFNLPVFARWIFRAIGHGVIAFCVAMLSVDEYTHNQSSGYWTSTTVCYYIVCLIPTVLIIFDTQNFTLLHAFAVFFCSVGSIFLFNWVFGLWYEDLYGVIDFVYESAAMWFIILLGTMIPVLVELACRGVSALIYPSYTQLLREQYDIERASLDKAKRNHSLSATKVQTTEKENEMFLKYRMSGKATFKDRVAGMLVKKASSDRTTSGSVVNKNPDGSSRTGEQGTKKLMAGTLMRYEHRNYPQFQSIAQSEQFHSHHAPLRAEKAPE